MGRCTENRLIGALSAVAVAGLIVMITGAAIALTHGDPGTTERLAASSPTGTYNPEAAKQAIVDSMSAARASAIQFATDHPELLPPRHPGLMPTPTATPVPLPMGVPCTSDQLTAGQIGENAATGGQMFVSVGIANLSDRACDLPAIRNIDALDGSGLVIGSVQVPARPCGQNFCIATEPLPMAHVDHAPGFHTSSAGMVSILIADESGCWGKPYGYVCSPNESRNLMMHFEDGIDIPVTLAGAVLWPDGSYPTVWSLRLVGPTTN
jgi:hypothetical protein